MVNYKQFGLLRIMFMSEIMKVDAHHHLWDLSLKKNSWLLDGSEETFLGDCTQICKSYLVSDYLKDIRNQSIVKSVAVQAGWDSAEPEEESRWLQSLADQYGFPHGIVGYADFASTNIEATLEAHCQFANVRGIRQILSWDPNPYYSGCNKNYIELKQWQDNFALLAKYNLSFDMQIYSMQLPIAVKIAQRNPDVQVIMEHAGMPLFRSDGDFVLWKKQLGMLAELPNIAIKISGLGMFDHNWSIGSIRPIVLTVIDLFGVERCMFASNFPVESLYSDFDRIFNVFKDIVKDFSASEIGAMFYANALRIYRL